MGLNVAPIPDTARPRITAEGGTVTVSFEARSTGTPTYLQATYVVDDKHPYEFDTPTNARSPKTLVGDVQAVRLLPRLYTIDLGLRRQAGATHVSMVTLNISIAEVDAAGGRIRRSGGEQAPPQRRTVTVTIA